jgi:hypothetical protein
VICLEQPHEPASLRAELYGGTIFLLPPTDASRHLVADVRERLADALGSPAFREVAHTLPNDQLFERIGALRRELYLAPRYHAAVCDVVSDLGLDPERSAFDPLRLRVILDRGHERPLAAPVYHPHRDTWYAHPRALLTWWIPLDDLSAEETFEFYPDYFRNPVANDSEIFDYDDWVRDGWELKIGWQKHDTEARFPHAEPGCDRGRALGFSCRAAENLLFSGAHFHATRPQVTGRTRFSLDFRIVDLPDHEAGLGAPDVDNRSRGSALRDYVVGPHRAMAPLPFEGAE